MKMKMDTLDTLVREDQAHLIHPLHYPKDHEHPIVMVEGRGAILKDLEGHEYIDGLSCLWNVNAGHGRAELAQAAAEQMARLAFVSSYAGTTNIPAIRLAERLVGLAYPNTSGVYFTTSGAESNESAFKAARYYWKIRGRPTKVKIFSRIHAYHGLTLGAMSATGMAAFHKMFGPLAPEFAQVAAPYAYRWPTAGDVGVEAADALERYGTGLTGKTLPHRRLVRARQYQQDIQKNRPVDRHEVAQQKKRDIHRAQGEDDARHGVRQKRDGVE